MRTLMVLGLGILIGAAALGAVWAVHHGDVTVRVTAERQEDGRVEVGLQRLGSDAEWQTLDRTRFRFLAADAEAGERFYSSPILVPVETQSESVASSYREYLLTSGREVAEIFNNYFESMSESEGEPGTMLCVVDMNDPGIDAICEGLEEDYNGAVERIEIADWDALRTELQTRIDEDDSIAGLTVTSVPTTLVTLEALDALETWVPLVYWIELLDQNAPSHEARFCQITHSGQVIERELDLFWGLASEISAAAAGQLAVDIAFSAHHDINEQAAAIRECTADGASVIATTLVEAEPLSPAIGEALEADIPVVSFNSGAEIADSVGTALHIALDDHEAGRLAGEEFNKREIEGTILCVIHEPNNVGLHDRCDGLEEVYEGSVERWSAEDPEAVMDELGARMGEDDIGAVLTLSVYSAYDARVARAVHELDVPVAAFGFSVGLARSVANGKVLFTILDHPEMQTYMSAVASVMVERWRLDPVAYFNGMRMLIQPQIADAEYMQALLDSMFGE